MPKGKALLIGVNYVDVEKYQGWDGKLDFCEADAQAVAGIAESRGFENTVLLSADATSTSVLNTIAAAAEELQSGDIFLLFYSGHGNLIDDRSGDEWADFKDEAWCLFDLQMLDDELYALWPKFADGVRIFVLSDSCHSGSMTRGATDEEMVAKAMPERAAKNIVRRDPEYYVRIRQTLPKAKPRIGATVRLISGCKDNQQSFENKTQHHGQFTLALQKVWNDGDFGGNYQDFYDDVLNEMPEYQNPNSLVIGADNDQFSAETPFTI
jgi:hypothetical protein